MFKTNENLVGELFFETCIVGQPEVFLSLDCTQVRVKKNVTGRNDGLKGKRTYHFNFHVKIFFIRESSKLIKYFISQ